MCQTGPVQVVVLVVDGVLLDEYDAFCSVFERLHDVRVRTVGEPLLPPVGVRFPEIDVVSHCPNVTRQPPQVRASTIAATVPIHE